MKTKVAAAALLAVLSSGAAMAQQTSGCFWARPIILDDPGNPLSGAGFGSISGIYKQVEWYSGNVQPPGTITNCSGKFSFDVGWNDADNNGINFTSEWSIPGIMFDTSSGDTLLFGNASVTLDCPNCKVNETKLLICTIPDDGLQKEIEKFTSNGYGVYVTDGNVYSQTKNDGLFTLGTDSLGYDGREYSTKGLHYAYSLDGKDFTKGDGCEDFDTIVKIGACVTCVPEPSGLLLGAAGAAALVLRRRRR